MIFRRRVILRRRGMIVGRLAVAVLHRRFGHGVVGRHCRPHRGQGHSQRHQGSEKDPGHRSKPTGAHLTSPRPPSQRDGRYQHEFPVFAGRRPALALACLAATPFPGIKPILTGPAFSTTTPKARGSCRIVGRQVHRSIKLLDAASRRPRGPAPPTPKARPWRARKVELPAAGWQDGRAAGVGAVAPVGGEQNGWPSAFISSPSEVSRR
jgi:hypothetical protein